MVAKADKLDDRVASGRTDRLADKDALDVFEMMQAGRTRTRAATSVVLLEPPIAGAVTEQALGSLDARFRRRGAVGIRMTVPALGGAYLTALWPRA